MIANFTIAKLQKISTGQVPKVLEASLAFATYAGKDRSVPKFFYTLFRARQSSEPLSNGS